MNKKTRVGVLGFAILSLSAGLSAQSIATVGDLLFQVLVQPTLPNYFVIPVAGQVQGVNGT